MARIAVLLLIAAVAAAFEMHVEIPACDGGKTCCCKHESSDSCPHCPQPPGPTHKCTCTVSVLVLFVSASSPVVYPMSHSERWADADEKPHDRSIRPLLPPPKLA